MLSVIGIEETDEWGSIVKSFADHDVYYLAEYAKAFQVHGDGEPVLFYYEGSGMRAINVAMKRDIAEAGNLEGKIPEGELFDLATPYGYGGPLIEGITSEASLKRLDEEYSYRCRSEGIVCEFVRFHPVLKNNEAVDRIYAVSMLGKTIAMDLVSSEQIWGDLTSKNRNMVRKAQKAGVGISWGRSPELYEEFARLYKKTMEKDNASEYYYFGERFFRSIHDDLEDKALMFYAEYESKIIAMSIILHTNQQMHYHLSASDREYSNLAPTNLLLFEAARWGCENGYRTFHLGGGLGGRDDSLYKFKKAFNRNSDYSFWIGKKVFDDARYEELVSIAENGKRPVIDPDFFPRYRAAVIG